MNQKVGMALTYPIILTLVALTIVTGLLVYVVPQVVQVFDNIGQELPFLTRALIATSETVQSYGLLMLIAIVAAIFGFFRLLRQPEFRHRFDSFKLKLPITGELTSGLNTARFARTLSILAASGVPILEALKIASQVVRNVPMSEAIQAATARVREGASISGSLEKSGLFPPMTVHLIASGESSGKLEDMLERAAHYQERETTMTITTIVGLFEHFMILAMGLVVLLIVLAILLPIFDLNQLVK
jgi:general secretion pathway protein F